MKRIIFGVIVASVSGLLIFPCLFGATAGLFFGCAMQRHGFENVTSHTPQIVLGGVCIASPVAGFLVGMLVGWAAREYLWQCMMVVFASLLVSGLLFPSRDPLRIEPLTTVLFWCLTVSSLALGGYVCERLASKERSGARWLAIASLVTGILAFVLAALVPVRVLALPAIVVPVSALLALSAIVLGVLHLRWGGTNRAMAIAGVGTGSVLLVVAASLVAVAISAALRFADRVGSTEIDRQKQRPAPDFTLTDTQGTVHTLSQYRGGVVALNFWSTWCSECRRELPDLVRLDSQYRSQGLVVLGVSDEDAAVQHAFAVGHGISYPLLVSNRLQYEPYSKVWALPTTFIIDRRGLVREVLVGYLKGALENNIIPLLSEGG